MRGWQAGDLNPIGILSVPRLQGANLPASVKDNR